MRRSRRELRRPRDGELALGAIDARDDSDAGPASLAYHFTTAQGRIVSGRDRHLGYRLVEDAAVPVFYAAADPRDHVVACGCCFEAE